ncbi:unnamed protein product [Linum trigynum]|uniref:Uncharacterized protein n=1 Tax=Linum trigynum TaxID=586398 RepID=A0AAV2FYZ9_9ROSI
MRCLLDLGLHSVVQPFNSKSVRGNHFGNSQSTVPPADAGASFWKLPTLNGLVAYLLESRRLVGIWTQREERRLIESFRSIDLPEKKVAASKSQRLTMTAGSISSFFLIMPKAFPGWRRAASGRQRKYPRQEDHFPKCLGIPE